MVMEDALVEEDRQGQRMVGEPRPQVMEDELGVGGEEVVARRQVRHEPSRA